MAVLSHKDSCIVIETKKNIGNKIKEMTSERLLDLFLCPHRVAGQKKVSLRTRISLLWGTREQTNLSKDWSRLYSVYDCAQTKMYWLL